MKLNNVPKNPDIMFVWYMQDLGSIPQTAGDMEYNCTVVKKTTAYTGTTVLKNEGPKTSF